MYVIMSTFMTGNAPKAIINKGLLRFTRRTLFGIRNALVIATSPNPKLSAVRHYMSTKELVSLLLLTYSCNLIFINKKHDDVISSFNVVRTNVLFFPPGRHRSFTLITTTLRVAFPQIFTKGVLYCALLYVSPSNSNISPPRTLHIP